MSIVTRSLQKCQNNNDKYATQIVCLLQQSISALKHKIIVFHSDVLHQKSLLLQTPLGVVYFFN